VPGIGPGHLAAVVVDVHGRREDRRAVEQQRP
jgi:hypothetical protein